MIVSRGLNLLRATNRQINVKNNPFAVQVRSKWRYREPQERPKWGDEDFKFYATAEILGGFMWWWILYNCYYHYDHIIGEFPYPEPENWTNEELGIPSSLTY